MTIRRFNLFAAAVAFFITLRVDNTIAYYVMAVFFAANLALSFKAER